MGRDEEGVVLGLTVSFFFFTRPIVLVDPLCYGYNLRSTYLFDT